MELAAFVDGGSVYSHEADWTLDDLHTSWRRSGCASRRHDAVRLRFDVARSPEDTRFLLPLWAGVLALHAAVLVPLAWPLFGAAASARAPRRASFPTTPWPWTTTGCPCRSRRPWR